MTLMIGKDEITEAVHLWLRSRGPEVGADQIVFGSRLKDFNNTEEIVCIVNYDLPEKNGPYR